MTFKISYKDQIHRISCPETFDSLKQKIISTYPKIASRTFAVFYLGSDQKQVNINDNNGYQSLVKGHENLTKLKLFIETTHQINTSNSEKAQKNDLPEEHKIDSKAEKPSLTRLEEKKLEDNIEEDISKQVKIFREKLSQDEMLLTGFEISYINKIINRISLRTLKGKHVFAIFLSFPNSLFKAFGKKVFDTVLTKSNFEIQDILKSFDTLTILTESQSELQNMLEIVHKCYDETEANFDKKKWAIMEFLPRRSKKEELTISSILEIPVVTKYKYMCLLLDQKLMFEEQIDFIKEKAHTITAKFGPKLNELSTEDRIKIWRELIEPLFTPLLPGYLIEEAETRKQDLEKLFRVTVRNMTMLRGNSSTQELESMIGYNLHGRAVKITSKCSYFPVI